MLRTGPDRSASAGTVVIEGDGVLGAQVLAALAFMT
jgi:hypothetical protein